MPKRFNVVRAASALVEATLKTDKQVSIEFGVSIRTIEQWRSRLKVDEELQREFRRMANEKLSQWVGEIPNSLELAIGFIASAARTGDTTNPDMVKAITGAIATLNDVFVIQAAIQQRQQGGE
ncbi:helix-turn-helix domain-containing protein [Oscillatoria sp. FACHB-1407]|uniref:helix-turn-helix domain-containing protein n=1 Tax=Oscillatoria sp. FACHB-1407 TaxID=2692847 RepID=UPI0016865F26|nr:helix-turn-helix domain-containing protein [Oscillatoria sp. FACHB-1407]MBD2462267.1 helix-turn-helix domain-containing protein [Oscillatoria sp. FACHB-1407]